MTAAHSTKSLGSLPLYILRFNARYPLFVGRLSLLVSKTTSILPFSLFPSQKIFNCCENHVNHSLEPNELYLFFH